MAGATPPRALGATRPATPPQRSLPRQTGGLSAVIADPGDLTIGSTVSLDGSSSTGDIANFSWDFGDGTTPSGGSKTTHLYRGVDDYTIKLTVQDHQGHTDTASRNVRVIPAITELDGRPALGQITPASSFTALLALNASGPATISAKIGGTFLYSDRWDFQGGNAPALLEIPDVRVVNEDDSDLASLIDESVSNIPLANNVTLTLGYPVSGGGSESVTYTTSLLKPAGFSVPIQGAPPTPIPSPTPSPAPASPAPDAAGGVAPTPSPTHAPAGRSYAQATAAPRTATPAAPAPATPPAPAPTAPPPNIWAVTYPTYLPIVGRPANEDDVDDYYLKGDKDFHAADDPMLRRWAIKIARNGGVFPNDPQRAADNIYRYVNGVLGIGDPGELQTDLVLLGRIVNGSLVPGARRGEYICIAHAYFVSSLTRELGLPTRELTIGLARPNFQDNSGTWHVTYYQEGANQVWYAGAWHHYDTWLGTRDRTSYTDTYLQYIAWYAFSTQQSAFTDVNGNPVGLSGHDFSIGKFAGSPGAPEQWRLLDQGTRTGLTIAEPGPDAYQSAEAAPRPEPAVEAGIQNPPADGSGH
ncbi:MAG TPA: PKD domain-containing protein [Dehalococcoidia bacterium]|nr:PKD domain-containing protein [Dehalococcoidia bacterium]